MADAFAPLTARINQYRTALSLTGPAAATFERTVGPRLKKEVQIAAVAGFGADLRPFSNNPVRASHGYDSEQTGHGLRMEWKLRPVGVWVFGERGAGPHLIGAKGRFVKGPGYAHPVRGPVKHPGSTGKGAIKYAFKRVRTHQLAAARAGIAAVLAEVTHSG